MLVLNPTRFKQVAMLDVLHVAHVFDQLVSSGDGRSLFLVHLGLVDCLLLCYILSVRNHHLTQHRMGVGYALRVSPAVTRLTVYRLPQVACFVRKRELLAILSSHLNAAQK